MNMQPDSQTFQVPQGYLSRTKARQFFDKKEKRLPQAVWNKFSHLFETVGESRSGTFITERALFFDLHLQEYPEEQRRGEIYYVLLMHEDRYGLFTVRYLSADKVDILKIEELIGTEWREAD